MRNPALKKSLRIDEPVELDQTRNQSGPAGLMARAEARTVVAVEVLVEEDVVAPVRVGLKLLRAAVDSTTALGVTQEDALEARGQLAAHLEEIHEFSGARGTLDLEIVAVVQVVLDERAQDQDVHRHPDRTAPVGIAAEHSGVGLGG